VRLDKFLKVSRLIKRRTVAKEMAEAGRIRVNGKPAKPGFEVNIGDILEIGFGENATKAEILEIRETVKAEESKNLYRIL
jgi:ribosomal 50S subunit-recycling heat shock protein